MFLKRIDIVGFKSFADKTELAFVPGLTAVVGPNGSGKSNIADAIRWVLGEQSARNLRGSKMEDVIFAGSETRRSVNYCEVSLTLDNGDGHLPVVFDEVTITRRVYRSGESEYMLNKQPCRLRDISELFMDSGLGRESYSIIGQGKIEEMLSTRPEDRRGPFEDAAGIVKFRFRKREAERKLEETASNVVRVDDILAELVRQAGPLEEEARRAAVYQQLQNELNAVEISLLVKEIETSQMRYQQTARDVEAFSQDRERATLVLAEKETVLQDRRVAFDTVNARLEVLQRELLTAVEERQRADGDMRTLAERLEHTQATLSHRRDEAARLAVEVEELSSSEETYSSRLAAAQAALELKTAELEAAAHELDPDVRTRIENEIGYLNAELIEHHQMAAHLRNEIKVAEDSASSSTDRQLRLREEETRIADERTAIQKQVEELEARKQDSATQLESLYTNSNELTSELQEHVKEESACADEIHRLQAQAASHRSRIELLEDLESGYDGYQLGVKTVLQAFRKKELTGLHGSIANLISVDSRFETAIETALGAALQNVVVDTEGDARKAIDLLKKRQAGRATFMPLSVIKSRRLSQHDLHKVQTVTGFVAVASDLVRAEPNYRQIIEYLLGNVVIAETLQHANDLAKRLDYRVRIVTEDGDVVSPGGTMTGGRTARRGPGLLGRSRERQEQVDLLRTCTTQVENARKRQEALRARVEELQAQRSQMDSLARNVQRDMTELEARIREFALTLQNLEDKLQTITWDISQLNEGTESWRSRRQDAEQKLKETNQRLTEIERSLSEKRQELVRRDESLTAAREALTLVKVEMATLTQEVSGIQERIGELSDRRHKANIRVVQVLADVESAEQLIARTTQELAEKSALAEEMLSTVAEMEAAQSAIKMERQVAESDVATAEADVKRQQQALTEVEERLHRAQVLAERADSELNHALWRMGEAYHMTYEWAREHHVNDAPIESLRMKADALRKNVDAMGTVQTGAIEEWQRLSERMDFLNKERTDLEQAREQLLSVISEMDEEMSRRFRETFDQIRTEFQVMFRLLFNGGRADLTLTDESDLLRTGIDVAAQPPGKKLQNLNLMSGGERALTAMALLFAILRVRPVPFCVLDEVEAALDEANVNRFADQLRRFAQDTQFIVITHRRGTMEEADVLYGVTMQESGVSNLVSVRLAEDEVYTA